jgi:hypothetical protein
MANPWELICHHAYAVFQASSSIVRPHRQATPRVVNIPDEDFLPDGARPETGSIRFNQGTGGSLRIAATATPWRLLEGLRVEPWSAGPPRTRTSSSTATPSASSWRMTTATKGN